jgi:hypothetical protein
MKKTMRFLMLIGCCLSATDANAMLALKRITQVKPRSFARLMHIQPNDPIKKFSASKMFDEQSPHNGYTALHWAIHGQYDENHKLKVLVALFHGTPNPFIENHAKRTPQQEALLLGHKRTAALLEQWEQAYYDTFSSRASE